MPYGMASSPPLCCRRLNSGVGDVRGNFDMQVTFYPLASLGIAIGDYYYELAESAIVSGIVMASAQKMVVVGSYYAMLWHGGPSSLLYSDNVTGGLHPSSA